MKIHKIKFLCFKSSELSVYKFSCLRQWKMDFVGWRNRIPMFLELQFNWYFHLEVQKSFTLAPTNCRCTLADTAAHTDSSMKKTPLRMGTRLWATCPVPEKFIFTSQKAEKICMSFWVVYWYFWMYNRKEKGRKKERDKGQNWGKTERERARESEREREKERERKPREF